MDTSKGRWLRVESVETFIVAVFVPDEEAEALGGYGSAATSLFDEEATYITDSRELSCQGFIDSPEELKKFVNKQEF